MHKLFLRILYILCTPFVTLLIFLTITVKDTGIQFIYSKVIYIIENKFNTLIFNTIINKKPILNAIILSLSIFAVLTLNG